MRASETFSWAATPKIMTPIEDITTGKHFKEVQIDQLVVGSLIETLA